VPEGFNGKSFQLLKELVPTALRIGLLSNPENPMHRRARSEVPELGRQLGVNFVVVEANGINQAEAALDAAIKQGAEAIEIWGDPYVILYSSEVVALAVQWTAGGLPLSAERLGWGLISLGPDFAGFWRRAAEYVDKILRGERPAELPVWQPTGYHLAVNLKTAASLGVTVTPYILATADELIE
jgi:putative ABC transport system substrate-binding protein